MSKINSGSILLGFLAILFGLIGTWAFREYSKQPPVSVPERAVDPGKVVVPMASRTLEPGHRINIDDIALVKLSREEIRENGLDKGFMSNAAQIVGKTVKSEIRRGGTFDTREFYPDGTGPGIADRLKPGQRAVTVSLTPTNALIGFAGAGQIVDVLFHYGEKRKAASEDNEAQAATLGRDSEQLRYYQSATVTLVQSAEILALGNSSVPTGDANGISTQDRVLVTLAVSPADIEAIRVADGNGELSLSLRNPTDQKAVNLGAPKMLSEIIQIDSGYRQMEIYRGTRMTKVEFNTRGEDSRLRAVDRPDPLQGFDDETAGRNPDVTLLHGRGSNLIENSMIGSSNRTPGLGGLDRAHVTIEDSRKSLLDTRRTTHAANPYGARR